MKVILTDDVVGVGDIGESINVRPGYARNYLIPRGLAIESEAASARSIAHKMRQIEAKKKRMKGTAESRAKDLAAVEVVMELRVGSNGKAFGSIGARDIAAKLTALGFELDRRRVLLAEPIRKLGEHVVGVRLHQEVQTDVKIIVNPREFSKEEEEQLAEKARQNIETKVAAKAEKAASSKEASSEE